MATLIHSGRRVKIRQWANDWFSIEFSGKGKIVSPLLLKLSIREMRLVLKSGAEGASGTLLSEFRPNQDGTFTRRERKCPGPDAK
jgi:hypothetical protein